MTHISIEGMDGVGKSTTCKLLAERLNYKFVEKPLHYLFDGDDSFSNYRRIREEVNANDNRVFTSLFYGLGSVYLYDRFKDENIVTDRHLASNYAWSGDDGNLDVYELLIKKIGVPKLTVILYSPSDVIMERLKCRDAADSDIARVGKSEIVYSRMKEFCERFNLPHCVIDTSALEPNGVADRIVARIETI